VSGRFARTLPSASAFPQFQAGRLLHCWFRGLLDLHSRYGLRARQVANATLYIRVLQQLRHLHCRSDGYRVERTSFPGGDFHSTMDQRLSSRRTGSPAIPSGPLDGRGSGDCGVLIRSIVAGAVKDFYRMREEMRHGIERLGSAFRAARQVDDKSLVSDRSRPARKHGRWRVFQSFAAHLFGDAWHNSVGNRLGGLGSIVARSDARSARGQEDVHPPGIR